MNVAVVGYGNVGRFAVRAVEDSPDMRLAGVVRRKVDEDPTIRRPGPEVVTDVRELGKVDVALVCYPSRLVPEKLKELTSLGISTVDSFDIHGQAILDLVRGLDPLAKRTGAVAVVSAGWDPGTDSMLRALFEAIVPTGLTHTNFGPGMSMGHSVAARSIPGIRDAVSFTIPAGFGVHKRLVYVVLADGEDPGRVERAIKEDAYFRKDETRVVFAQSTDEFKDMGHGVKMERRGVSAGAHNQYLSFTMRVTNPAATAQVMVSAARAASRQKPGVYTLLDMPLADMLPCDREEAIRRFV